MKIRKPRNEQERKIAGYIIWSVVALVFILLVRNIFLKKDPSKILNQVNAEVFSVPVEKPQYRDLKHQRARYPKEYQNKRSAGKNCSYKRNNRPSPQELAQYQFKIQKQSCKPT